MSDTYDTSEANRQKVRGHCPKLVRDHCPRLMAENGWSPRFRIVTGIELTHALEKKLCEEFTELLQEVQHPHPDEEQRRERVAAEAADLIEAALALAARYGAHPVAVNEWRRKKQKHQGGFKEGYLLEDV